VKVKRRKLPPGSCLIFPDKSPRPVLVDKKFRRKLGRVNWFWMNDRQRFRGYLKKAKTRQYLHRYVIELARKYFPEVTFANGDPFDCRLVNLKPYRREHEGAQRRVFKLKSSVKQKGVCWHKQRKKWAAMIRFRSILRHLGYFDTAEKAAEAYARAWNLAHPDLKPVPERQRFAA